jgi:hypothetical protein
LARDWRLSLKPPTEREMTEAKIKVPEGMLEAAHNPCVYELMRLKPGLGIGYAAADAPCLTEVILEAALRWLSENPIVPTEERAQEMWSAKQQYEGHFASWEFVRWGACEWQRRMFLALDEDEPVKDLRD